MTATRFWTTPVALVLLVARSTSVAGDWLFQMALVWLVLELTGSSQAVSLTGIAEAIPVVLVGLLGGHWLDRGGRLRLLAWLDLLRAVLVALPVLLYSLGQLSFWHLVVLSVLMTAANLLFTPGMQSTLPALVPKEHLTRAHGLIDVTERVGRISGPGLAGVLSALMPVAGFFLVDSATFVISAGAFLLLSLWARRAGTDAKVERKGPQPSRVQQLAAGFAFVREQAVIGRIILVRSLNNFAWAAYLVATPLLVAHSYGQAVGAWGLLVAAYAVGQLIGGMCASRVSSFKVPPLVLLSGGWLFTAFGFVVLGLSGTVWVGCLGLLLGGLGGPLAHVSTDGYLAANTPTELQGRVFSLQYMTLKLVQMLGLALAGVLCAYLAAGSVLVLAGALMTLVSVTSLLFPIRRSTKEEVLT
ncbi:MFS transporter [Kutzneria viridogrisea]|uniref:MFS family permease n=1 Tax=Kutzneria viridogrisea TaxID=47990 RepID=A0ABR6BU14_9PSEU|nr:MFS family permease [Kutzneria viridogrisea]